MSLVDKIKELIAKEQEPTPNPEPTPPEPTPEPGNPEPEPEPTPEYMTKEAVDELLASKESEMIEAFTEVVKEFKGSGTPPVAAPAEPVNTSDFSEWNKEVSEIQENLKN